MAFFGGAECSSGGLNPLSRLAKQTNHDSTLQRDRLVSKRPDSFSQSMRSNDAGGRMQVGPSLIEFNSGPSMLQNGFDFRQPGLSPIAGQQFYTHMPDWEYSQKPHSEHEWTSDFRRNNLNTFQRPQPNVTKGGPATYQIPVQMRGMSSRMPIENSMRSNGGYLTTPHRSGIGRMQSQHTTGTSHDTAQLSDQQWNTMFNDTEASLESISLSSNPGNQSVDEILKSVLEVSLEEDKLWNQISEVEPKTELYTAMQIPKSEPAYSFALDNDLLSNQSPFQDGLRILANGDNLSLATLAFEAACQQDPSHVEAWRMLGNTHADNADEFLAMRAYEEAANLDPDNLEILMGLAVSFMNNGYDGKAYEALERWILIKYPFVSDAVEPLDASHFPSRHAQLEYVKNLFLTAARHETVDGQIDTAVQVGLGVLCFSGESYSMAVDCFSAALAANPNPSLGDNTQMDLHLLWNRYGAAMANMGRYDEAIDAFEMALAINTNFVRAHYNLAVLYHNTNKYTSAAENALEALSKQNIRQSKAPKRQGEEAALDEERRSEELYEMLRKILRQLNRWDLVDGVKPGMSISSYKREILF